MKNFFLGIDVGSTTLKAVLLDENLKIINRLYRRTKPAKAKPITCTGRCFECGACNIGALKNTVTTFLSDAGLKEEDMACTVVTGSQIVEDTHESIDFDYKVSEVTAHVAGAKLFFQDCKAILDVGGQDSKAMIYNEGMQMWNSKMSGICAAGTGAFLDSVALKLAVPVEEMAQKADLSSELEFSSVCAVLSATSINKFKNRYPIGQIIGGACKAQARTIMSGVGEIFHNYKGRIVFQGGVAYNKAVCEFLRLITGNEIVVPEYNGVMGAMGSASLAKEYYDRKKSLREKVKVDYGSDRLKSISLRTKYTRKDFLVRKNDKVVWRNLFFPPEILNAFGAKMLTLETYAALFARNRKKIKHSFDVAAYKGFTGAETCSFLRVLEGIEVPKPVFGVSTSQPCLQGERIFHDLIRNYNMEENFFSLHTPVKYDESAVEHVAEDLQTAVGKLEKALGAKLDQGRLEEACELSNRARDTSLECNKLRFTSPPLLRGGLAIYFAAIFSQLWGKKELVEIQEQYLEDLTERRNELAGKVDIDNTHRILWLHLPPFYDSRLLDYIELECNAPIVFEEANFVGWDPLDVKDPYRSLARKLLTVGFLDPQQRVEKIKKYSIRGKFNGCILYNHMFGRCSMADASFIKHLREELDKALIPLLVLDGDCIDPTVDPCSTYTKINAYTEALNSKKFGNIFGYKTQ
ncbi:MAG: 2-hydroxyacyl-CoA dehydratase [Victivallales bacterium]|nr:2-hydroxyacyl-CoA dehydratase [Victivallales bacterium]MCF7889136.1 2-hydroxyacyl-CoA dehydratase [Victivallales bacterium]